AQRRNDGSPAQVQRWAEWRFAALDAAGQQQWAQQVGQHTNGVTVPRQIALRAALQRRDRNALQQQLATPGLERGDRLAALDALGRYGDALALALETLDPAAPPEQRAMARRYVIDAQRLRPK